MTWLIQLSRAVRRSSRAGSAPAATSIDRTWARPQPWGVTPAAPAWQRHRHHRPDRAQTGPQRPDQRISKSSLASEKHQLSTYRRVLAQHRPFSSGSASPRPTGGCASSPAVRLPSRWPPAAPRPHQDARAVSGQDEQRLRRARLRDPGRAERGDIDGHADDGLPPSPDHVAAAAGDSRVRGVERAAGRLDRSQLRQGVRVPGSSRPCPVSSRVRVTPPEPVTGSRSSRACCPSRAGGSAAVSASTRVTSSRATASREAYSSALARSFDSSPTRLRSRSASARAAASKPSTVATADRHRPQVAPEDGVARPELGPHYTNWSRPIS
jgi:hypothetical protein